jgi:hypothetical protein
MDTFHGTSNLLPITASFVNNGNNANWTPETAYTLTLNLASMGNPSGSFSYTITIGDNTKAAINSYTSSYNGSATGQTDQNGYVTISGTFSVGNATAIANIPIPRTQATTITATITRSGYTTYTSTLAVPVDTSQTYTWLAYPTTVDEGTPDTYTYQIRTSQATGASYPYQYFKWEIWLSFVSGGTIAQYADFPASQGYFATAASSPDYFGAFTVTPLADLVTEGYEYFEVRVKANDYVQLYTPQIRINDTSLTPTLYGPITGSSTWGTVPAGKTKCAFVLIGGGGGGAGAGGFGAFAGGGGAAGQVLLYDYDSAVSVTPGDSVSYSIGAAGGGGSGASDGGNGQNSSFTIGSIPYYAIGGKGGTATGDGSGGYISGINILGGQGMTGSYPGAAAGGGGTGNGVSGGGENGGAGSTFVGIGTGGNGGSARIANLTAAGNTVLSLRAGGGGGGGAVSTSNGTAYGGKGGSDGGNFIFYGGNGSSGAGNGGATGSDVGGHNYGNGGGGASAYLSSGNGGDGSGGALWFYFF